MARQSGLGKGLGALIPVAPSNIGDGLQDIPVGMIRPNPNQPRKVFNEEALASLAGSIAEVGVLQPILVRRQGEFFEIIAGERRWQAAQRAGLSTVPGVVQDRDEFESLQLAIIENLHREDLNPLEEAAAYQQLIDEFGLTHEAVAERVGKSRAAVSNTLRLMQLPARIQRFVMDGQISAGHARALLGSPDRRFQEELGSKIVEKGLSVREVEGIVKSSVVSSDSDPKEEPPGRAAVATVRPAVVVEVERLLGESLLTGVSIDLRKGSSGAIRINFSDIGDLHRIASAIVDPRRDY